MTGNSSKPWLAVLVLFLVTGSGLTQSPDDRRPKSIVDYYFLLPQKYLPYLTSDSRTAREAAIRRKDVGFLKAGLETDEVSTTLSLFKKSDGTDVIAVENRSCPGPCASRLNLLSYADGQWTEVTQLIPAIDDSKLQASLAQKYVSRPNEPARRTNLIYTLRKQTIEVHEHWSGMVLGEFEWANDAFTFKPEEVARKNYRVLAATNNDEGDGLEIIGIDPELPANLPLNGHLRVKIAYELTSTKYCFIWVEPVALEQRLPDDFSSGSLRYGPGAGVTTAFLGFNNQAHLNMIKVTMADEQRKPIVTLTYPVDANWKGKRECPTFHVECFPNTDSSGASIACMAYPSGVVPGQELTYQWNLTNGSIVTGQGTRRITVNTIDAGPLKAELEIGNLPLTCEKKTYFTRLMNPRDK